MHRFFLLGLCSLFFLAGCTTVDDAWEFTSKQYRTYLNKPAALDWEDTGDSAEYELTLGRAVIAVDSQLAELLKAMENSDRRPDENWVMTMLNRFPWLSGLAITDEAGNALIRIPDNFMKPFDVAPLVEDDPKQKISDLRAYVQQNPLGAEIYVAKPVYRDGVLSRMVVVHFDMRSLLAGSPNPGSFMIASPEGVIWPGSFKAESTPVVSENWSETLLDETSGVIGNEGAKFFWTTRYLGNLPLIYAIPIDASKVERNEENLYELDQVDHLRIDPNTAGIELGQDAQPPASVQPPAPVAPAPAKGGASASGNDEVVGNVGNPNVTPSPSGEALKPEEPKSESLEN